MMTVTSYNETITLFYMPKIVRGSWVFPSLYVYFTTLFQNFFVFFDNEPFVLSNNIWYKSLLINVKSTWWVGEDVESFSDLT